MSTKNPGAATGAYLFYKPLNLAAVIHVEFHRVWRHAVTVLLFLLQLDVAFDLVFAEHAALGQEFVVGGQAV